MQRLQTCYIFVLISCILTLLLKHILFMHVRNIHLSTAEKPAGFGLTALFSTITAHYTFWPFSQTSQTAWDTSQLQCRYSTYLHCHPIKFKNDFLENFSLLSDFYQPAVLVFSGLFERMLNWNRCSQNSEQNRWKQPWNVCIIDCRWKYKPKNILSLKYPPILLITCYHAQGLLEHKYTFHKLNS